VKKGILIIIILIFLLFGCSSSTTNIDSSTNTGSSTFETVTKIDNINGETTQILGKKIIYEDIDNNKFIFDPFVDYRKTIPTEIKYSKFVQITDEVSISVQYEYESKNIIVYYWNYKNAELSQKGYQLENINSMEFLDAQYFSGDIFVALDGGIIIKINNSTEDYKIDIGFDIANINDVLTVNNEKLYVVASREDIYNFDKINNEFNKLIPSPVLVDQTSFYYIKNGNSIKAINGTYSAEFTLPFIPEDNSLHNENSYYVIDSYKDSFLIKRWSSPNGSLYVYSENELIEIPIVEFDSLRAKFINEKKLLYTDETNLYMYNIDTLEKKLILENTSPFKIEQINEDRVNKYFALTSYNQLEILKIKK